MTRILIEDGPGLVGFAMLCAGVYMLAGTAWTLIAAGSPLVFAYVTREARAARLGRKG